MSPSGCCTDRAGPVAVPALRCGTLFGYINFLIDPSEIVGHRRFNLLRHEFLASTAEGQVPGYAGTERRAAPALRLRHIGSSLGL